jgi:hypothetical protein
MTEDFTMIVVVSLIWAVLAALYAFVPMFNMPGSTFVWGSGAIIFLCLAIVIAITERNNANSRR